MKKQNVETTPPLDCTSRWQGENFDDYFVRLYENKNKYGLTCKAIAGLLNAENGKNYGESAYRKRYAFFNSGRLYERDRNTGHVAERILAISDLHIPYQVPIDVFSVYKGSVDTLVINGDIMDCQSISFFPKKYRISFIDEMTQARTYLINLIDMICPKNVIIIKGNHEHRLLRYLSDKINEDLLSIMPDSPMDLIVNDGFKNKDRMYKIEIYYPPLKDVYNEKGISVCYSGEWYARIGNIIFAHPLTYSGSMLRTAEKAVNYFTRSIDRDFTTIVLAHTHKVGYYKLGDISIYEQGCLCQLDMLDYADGKLQDSQQNGYMYICLDSNGNIIEDKTRLITTL